MCLQIMPRRRFSRFAYSFFGILNFVFVDVSAATDSPPSPREQLEEQISRVDHEIATLNERADAAASTLRSVDVHNSRYYLLDPLIADSGVLEFEIRNRTDYKLKKVVMNVEINSLTRSILLGVGSTLNLELPLMLSAGQSRRIHLQPSAFGAICGQPMPGGQSSVPLVVHILSIQTDGGVIITDGFHEKEQISLLRLQRAALESKLQFP